jgi:hypothetical protein
MAFMNTKNGFITITTTYQINNNGGVNDYSYLFIKSF